MDVLARMEGFWVCILFLILYLFVACEHLGRLFQPSLKYFKLSQYGVNMYLDLVSRILPSKYWQEMDANKLLINLPRIYCARVLFVCIVCIRQFRYTTCILVECFDIDICILSLSCKRLL